MKLSDKSILRRLGDGDAIDTVCGDAEISRDEFDLWWRRTSKSRLPSVSGEATVDVGSSVQIQRDRWGIPHILAENDADLFFGFGYTMAQDRLFQLDYLRRKGLGRLSEILGEDGLEMDTIARTVGLNRIAESEWEQLPDDVRQTLESFSRGVNALIEGSADQLPIEFDLLDYQPEPWTPVDCLAIENEFRWYLTGRFPVIVIPELAKRTLGTGSLYEEFLLGEADEESILQPGDYSPRPQEVNATLDPVGHVMGDPDAATGSNNWVVSGTRTTTGAPLLGSDPHIAFEAVSCWYEAHLSGGSFNVAGMAYVGIPAIMFGRNRRVGWAITNNICSQRDLYKEQTDSDHPSCFQYDGQWEREREVIEEIKVRGREPIKKCVRFSRNGPVVNEILPKEFPAAHDNETITLKWIGAYGGGWLTSLLAMDRANNVNEFREALRPWHVPTFSIVIADVDGQVAFQSVGRIPIRKSIERGMRPGWEPDHQWQGLIPFESMPHMIDPSRGWIASANNRLAPDDYPYKLFGCWNSGWRAARIRQMIESRERLAIEDMREMHQDTMSLRAVSLTPALLANLSSREDGRIRQAISILQSWDFQIQSDSVAATIFNTFFALWCQEVAAERFEADQAEL
ncbi:MAG: penicillin acylase family protein, partial [Planctomycetes bacterium]|nr:penicillin acylase family protein [Planctomycetota bacterium]